MAYFPNIERDVFHPSEADVSDFVVGHWQEYRQWLPEDLDDLAQRCGAASFQPHARIKQAIVLVHLALVWAVVGKSLQQTVAWAKAAGIASISHVGFFSRLQRMPAFFEALVEHLHRQLEDEQGLYLKGQWQVLAADGTSTTGYEQQIKSHWAVDLSNLSAHQIVWDADYPMRGETLLNFEIRPNQLWLGDRIYCSAKAIAYVQDHSADLIVRYIRKLTLYDAPYDGKTVNLLELVRKFPLGTTGDVSLWVYPTDHAPIPVRLIVKKLSDEAWDRELEHMESSRTKITPESATLARYLLLITTVSDELLSATDILALYRLRWQVELRFKHAKGNGFGQLKCVRSDTNAVWLWSHLFLQLLMDLMFARADTSGEIRRHQAKRSEDFVWEQILQNLTTLPIGSLPTLLQRYSEALPEHQAKKKQRTHDLLTEEFGVPEEQLWLPKISPTPD